MTETPILMTEGVKLMTETPILMTEGAKLMTETPIVMTESYCTEDLFFVWEAKIRQKYICIDQKKIVWDTKKMPFVMKGIVK